MVYVPCGLAGPYGDIAKLFSAAHPEIALHRELGNELPLRNKIRDGATPDVFISLGDRELAVLREHGKVDSGGEVQLALAPLALVSAPGNPLGLKSLDDLADPKVKHIALGDDEAFSAGYEAQAALKQLGLWDKVEPKVIETPMAANLLGHTAAGKVDAAIVYKSCMGETHEPGSKPTGTNVTFICDVPAEAFTPIPVLAVKVTGAEHPDAARQFLEFIAAADARKPWVDWFFEPVAPPAE